MFSERAYIRWDKSHTSVINKYFQEYTEADSIGTQGPLPGESK